MTLQIAHSRNNLHNIALNFDLGKSFSSTQFFIYGLIMTKLEKNIDVLRIFKEVIEAYHMCVVQGTVDPDFTHELLFGPRFGEGALGDHLGCKHFFTFQTCEFLHSGEPSFS